MRSQHLADEARSLLHVPFRRQGRTSYGVDCAGLLVLAAERVGCDLSAFDDQSYGHVSPAGKLEAALDAALTPVALTSLHVGAVVLLDTPGGAHVGIVGEQRGHLSIIHATELRGCVVEHRIDSHIRAAIVKAYALPTD